MIEGGVGMVSTDPTTRFRVAVVGMGMIGPPFMSLDLSG
jgi:hypothetical protein